MPTFRVTVEFLVESEDDEAAVIMMDVATQNMITATKILSADVLDATEQ